VTPQLHVHVLASGSKGNATIIEGPAGSVLVDCGISRRSLWQRASELGVDLGRVAGILVTHEHSDHVAGISVVCNHYAGPLFATAGTVAARPYLSEQDFTLISPGDAFEVGGIAVETFPTSHDVADPIGARFETADDAVAVCTDTGVITESAERLLHGARIIALESNHDERMLASGPYPAYLKRRIAGSTGHLSNAQAAEALPRLVTEDTETVIAMHLSQENNRPSVCVRTLATAVGAEPTDALGLEARTPDGHLTIVASTQDRPISVW
jgi:phosphoribosyl 1,2-cyclic phosphodiesterase